MVILVLTYNRWASEPNGGRLTFAASATVFDEVLEQMTAVDETPCYSSGARPCKREARSSGAENIGQCPVASSSQRHPGPLSATIWGTPAASRARKSLQAITTRS